MEVLTALAVANGAYKTITTFINNGREISDCINHLNKWFDASSDITFAQKSAENPSMVDTLFRKGSIESTAANAIIAKKKLEEQERHLRELITLHYGVDTYKEMMQMRIELREKRKLAVYKRKKLQKNLVDTVVIIIFLALTLGLGYFVYLMFKGDL